MKYHRTKVTEEHIYTGGCKQWQNSEVSSKTKQIGKIEDGGIKCLEKNLVIRSMTDPNTLTEFIKWCTKKYPANCNSLIFWDHGSGTVKGFGYDEKFAFSGSMSLSEINKVLTKANVKFDFVGFDACHPYKQTFWLTTIFLILVF